MITGFAILLMVAGVYLLLLTQSPEIIPGHKVQQSTYKVGDAGDFVEIPSINLKVPFFQGPDARTLDKGAWWRWPDRGSPSKGGNFILSAHRFHLALTPWATKDSSPFYHLDRVKEGDPIKVYFEGKWYEYRATKLYSVKPNAVEIEAPSKEAKMTLYSCSLLGQADGRYVVEAKPVQE